MQAFLQRAVVTENSAPPVVVVGGRELAPVELDD